MGVIINMQHVGSLSISKTSTKLTSEQFTLLVFANDRAFVVHIPEALEAIIFRSHNT